MNTLSIDCMGIIFSLLNPSICQLGKLKLVCKRFNTMLQSSKLFFLYEGKYMEWWCKKLMNNPAPHKDHREIFKCEKWRSRNGNTRTYATYTRKHPHAPWDKLRDITEFINK